MPARTSQDLDDLARLARDGSLDLSQVSLRVKTDLLMSTPQPPQEDLAAFSEIASALIPIIDEPTALILARKLAGWRHTPEPVLEALAARGGPILTEMLGHGMPLSPAMLEELAEIGDTATRTALAARTDLTGTAVLLLVAHAERTLDLALIGNPRAPLPQAAVATLVARSRGDETYRPGLLARSDLSNLELAPLFLQARPERRLAIIDSLSARDAMQPGDRRPAVPRTTFSDWLVMAGEDRIGAFGAIASHLGGSPALTSAIAGDASRDLAALCLIACGASPEEATRFLIRLGDETAHSVERIFALVELMRMVRPAVAFRLAMAIAGVQPAAMPQRKGQHQPAMDPSGTPARAGLARPEAQPGMSELLGRITRRDRG